MTRVPNQLLGAAVVLAALVLLTCWRRDYRARHGPPSERPYVASRLLTRIPALHLDGQSLWNALAEIQKVSGARMCVVTGGKAVPLKGERPRDFPQG